MERICRIRNLPNGHNFTLMCRDLSELSTYSFVDNVAFRLIKNNTPGNYTFILKGTKEVPRRLLQDKRKTIGMRVPSNPIAQMLLETLGEPMLSTSLMFPWKESSCNEYPLAAFICRRSTRRNAARLLMDHPLQKTLLCYLTSISAPCARTEVRGKLCYARNAKKHSS